MDKPLLPLAGARLRSRPTALEEVNEQAALLRADLADLRHQLAQVEVDSESMPARKLREANDHLLLAATRAEAIARTAATHLGGLSAAKPDAPLARLMRGEAYAAAGHDASVGDLREANERLVIAALTSQELEASALEAHRRQIGFLATVAHELRNPLMPLRLAAVMLDRARTDDEAHARLQATITGQVAQMTRLIGDLLEGSRISTGEFRLERTLIEIGEVLRRSVETAQPSMDGRGHRLTVHVPAGPVMVLGDAVRLVQVFGNLLENSSKYTPAGGHITLRQQSLTGSVSVTISDNGIGITPVALPHVFDMFVRDAHATAVDEGGLGIGLAVVRELVRAHEGTVIATSPGQGKGSTFVVTLPVVPGTLRPAAQAAR
ncbi:MAG: sensor histidine kinase [Burkholderiales bacterium]|nr:sensor histidine kinase [Burkholderiales bacterium]